MPPIDLSDAGALRRAYVDEGLSLSAIAKAAGCSYTDVREALLAEGIEIRRSGPAPIAKLRNTQWLRTQVGLGRSAKEIAAALGCAEGTVRSALVAAGLGPGRSGPRSSVLDDTSFLARAYVVEKRSVRSIAEEIGCTKDAVLAALRANGVPIRGRGRSAKPPSVEGGAGKEPPAALAAMAAPQPAAVSASEVEIEIEAAHKAVPIERPSAASEAPAEPEVTDDLEEASGGPAEPEASEPEPAAPELPSAAPAEPRITPHGDDQRRSTRGTVAKPPSPPSSTGGYARRPPASMADSGSVPVPPLGRVEVEIEKIEQKTFPIARRGYDRDEVDAYLGVVASEFRKVVRSAREAVNAARAASPAPDPAPAPGPAPVAVSTFDDIGSRVAGVLASAAEAAQEIKAAAEQEALLLRQRARDEFDGLRRAHAEQQAKLEQMRDAVAAEADEILRVARREARALLDEAQQRATEVEAEAESRASTLERTIRAKVEAVLAEARRDYEHLHSVQQQCVDRLASAEFLAKHARDGLSDGLGQPIDELLRVEALRDDGEDVVTSVDVGRDGVHRSRLRQATVSR